MQGFLTRAGQASGCRCKTCVDVAKTIIRRSTTGAEVSSNARGRLPYRHAFTTLYTSIFATAAVVDAKYKDDRRKELEGQISEAKDAVSRLQIQNAELLERTGYDARSYDEPSAPPRRTETTAPIAVPREFRGTTSSVIFEQCGGAHWAVFHGSKFKRTLDALKENDYTMLEEWLELSEQQEELRPVRSPSLETQEANVLQLVDYLLHENDLIQSRRGRREPTRNRLRETIDRLKARGYPNFRPDFHLSTKNRRHSGIARHQFADMVSQDIDADVVGTVERLCYNLLTAQRPLTINDYNKLILQFSKWGYRRLAQCVLKSHFAHFRIHHAPSAAVALTHDANFGNYAGVHRGAAVIFKKRDRYLAENGALLLEAAVRALTRISNVADAAVIFCHGLAMGLTIAPGALVRLLGLCIWKLDRNLAVMLIRALVEYSADGPGLQAVIGRDNAIKSVLLHQVHYLLDISNLWQDPAKLGQRLKDGGVDPEKFRRFRVDLTMCDTERQIDQTVRMLRRLRHILPKAPAMKPGEQMAEEVQDMCGSRGAAAAADFDFHLRAAMPESWTVKRLESIRPLDQLLPRTDGNAVAEGEARVWTEEDYQTARANLRIAALSREVANCSVRFEKPTPVRQDMEFERKFERRYIVADEEQAVEAVSSWG